MRQYRHQAIALGIILLLASLWIGQRSAGAVQASPGLNRVETESLLLSPYWGHNIRQWSHQIGVVSRRYGLDPDLIAAVIKEESNGEQTGVSWAGAVGLMGVMPAGPGLEWRPDSEALLQPATNLQWGVAILAEIVQQSGGDFFSALAAYSGGWEMVDSRIPRLYARNVLDHYGRAVAMRSGISPDIAAQWTVAIEMRRGHVAPESLLVLGSQPVSGLQKYGEHIIFDYVDDRSGQVYAIKAYAVPVALMVPAPASPTRLGPGDQVETQLQVRLGAEVPKEAGGSPHVLLACLPSLSRLRGRVSTRWFAPSYCPSWHR